MVEFGRDPLSDPTSVRVAFPELAEPWYERSNRFAGPLRKALLDARQTLSAPDLAAATRTLVLMERECLMVGGSPNTSRFLFAQVMSNDLALGNELAGWVIAHRGGNPYTPWDSPSDARSWDERAAEIEADRLRSVEHTERMATAQARRVARAEAAAERQREHSRAAAERRPKRLAVISEALAQSDIDCLREVIDSRETLDYWPESIAEKCRNALNACSVAELNALLAKVRSTRAEAWRALREPIRDRLDATTEESDR
jgi:hypothetical protein